MSPEKEPIFTVSNHHTADCGPAPQIDDDQPGYFGYFENSEGEQWIFRYDPKEKRAWVWGGDCDWERLEVILAGGVPTPLNVLMDEEERTWLLACVQAALGYEGVPS